MNFKEFCKNKESICDDNCNSKNVQDESCVKKNKANNYINVEDRVEEYSKLTKDELLKEFLKESGKLKQSGNFNESQIENMRSTLAPFLNEEQKTYFEQLMGMVE